MSAEPALNAEHYPLWHQQLLKRMMEVHFPGRDELAAQLDCATSQQIDQNGSLAISYRGDLRAPVTKTIPVEAWAKDEDGILIQALLFTRDGQPYMLEILRGDGLPVKRLPACSEFEIQVLGE